MQNNESPISLPRSVDIQLSHTSLAHFYTLAFQMFSKTLGLSQKIGILERTNLICPPRKAECPQSLKNLKRKHYTYEF